MAVRWKTGDIVVWKWGNGIAQGEVLDVRPEYTQIESKGSLIARKGTSENPAVIILHTNKTLVLKLASELIATE